MTDMSFMLSFLSNDIYASANKELEFVYKENLLFWILGDSSYGKINLGVGFVLYRCRSSIVYLCDLISLLSLLSGDGVIGKEQWCYG